MDLKTTCTQTSFCHSFDLATFCASGGPCKVPLDVAVQGSAEAHAPQGTFGLWPGPVIEVDLGSIQSAWIQSALKQMPLLDVSLTGSDPLSPLSVDAVQLTADGTPVDCDLVEDTFYSSQIHLTCSVPPGTQKLVFSYSPDPSGVEGTDGFHLSMFLQEADGSCHGLQEICNG